jgi:hypothetical protein
MDTGKKILPSILTAQTTAYPRGDVCMRFVSLAISFSVKNDAGEHAENLVSNNGRHR